MKELGFYLSLFIEQKFREEIKLHQSSNSKNPTENEEKKSWWADIGLHLDLDS